MIVIHVRYARQIMDDFTPIIIIELILVFGGVLLFAWWQFRDLKKEREKNQQRPNDAPKPRD